MLDWCKHWVDHDAASLCANYASDSVTFRDTRQQPNTTETVRYKHHHYTDIHTCEDIGHLNDGFLAARPPFANFELRGARLFLAAEYPASIKERRIEHRTKSRSTKCHTVRSQLIFSPKKYMRRTTLSVWTAQWTVGHCVLGVFTRP